MTTNKAVLPTQNKEWGFWGTMANSKKATAAWPVAMAVITEATNQPAEAVRTFLDSRDGRYFADEVGNFLHGGLNLPDAVSEAAKRWMTPANQSSVFSHLPGDTTYLTACILDHIGQAEHLDGANSS